MPVIVSFRRTVDSFHHAATGAYRIGIPSAEERQFQICREVGCSRVDAVWEKEASVVFSGL